MVGCVVHSLAAFADSIAPGTTYVADVVVMAHNLATVSNAALSNQMDSYTSLHAGEYMPMLPMKLML